ncbi:MAG: fibronectin type III domain-containing protein [Chloroflexota bacterium]|nr:fibronectin type III domain-containing protein [Chloroflexota bacterium]
MPRKPRKYIQMAGALIVFLLLVGGAFILVAPRQDAGPSPITPQPTKAASAGGTLRAEPGDTVVNLTWEAAQGASGYLVYRNGGSTPLNSTPITATTYIDIGLSNGRIYTYTVTLADGAGNPGKRLAETGVAPRSK